MKLHMRAAMRLMSCDGISLRRSLRSACDAPLITFSLQRMQRDRVDEKREELHHLSVPRGPNGSVTVTNRLAERHPAYYKLMALDE